MSTVIIRNATLSDKDAVIQIRDDVFGGIDYIRSFYGIFIQMENSYPYVAVIEEEIVGFCVAFIVDDMTTLISRAARVSPRHSGKGVFKKLMAHIKTSAKGMGASKYRFTTDELNGISFSRTFETHYKHISTKGALCYTITDCMDVAGLDQIPQASNLDLQTYFTSEKYSRYLFPEGIMNVFWVPYSLRPSNIGIIKTSGDVSVLSDVKLCKGILTGLVSIATVFQCSKESFGCNIDIYGSDSASLRQHIKQHLRFYVSVAAKPVYLIIYSFCDLNELDIHTLANDIKLKEMPWKNEGEPSYRFDKMHLYEGNLPIVDTSTNF